jgi:hypothetical protein
MSSLMTKSSGVRIVADPNYRGNLAAQLQGRLSQRSLNAALRAYAEAMSSAQVLETGLGLLLLHVQHERTTQKTLEELTDLHGYLFRRPLGNLIKLLKKEVPVPPRLEADLTTALDLRNLIAHRYFRERLAEWLLPSGLTKVTMELKEIKMTFDLVSKKIHRLEESLCEKATYEKELLIVKEKMEEELLPALLKAYASHRQMTNRGRRLPPNKGLQGR